MAAEGRAARPEEVVAHCELGDGSADRLDLARELAAEDPVPRPHEAAEEAPEERFGRAAMAVRAVDGRGADPDQEFVLPEARPLDVLEPQNVRRPVPVVNDRPHDFTILSSVRCARWMGPPCSQA